MKRGIYLVANRKSQEMCENLIYSIRKSSCELPIRVIHFGGEELNSKYILAEAELLKFEGFSEDAQNLIQNLQSVLTECPLGFLYRFLAWFSDWEEFIYADNDIVALTNWTEMFAYLNEQDLVHADEEYTTGGIYNYIKPELIQILFGEHALKSAITAGHIVVKRSDKMITDIYSAISWFKQNPDIPKKHDQSLLHVASLLGNWKILNLCKAPHNWLTTWAGDYKNSLQIIQQIQIKKTNISHIHYSGGTPDGNLAIQDLLFSLNTDRQRLAKLSIVGLKSFTGLKSLQRQYFRAKRYLKNRLR